MKKQISLIALLLAIVMALTACVAPNANNGEESESSSESRFESNETDESSVETSEEETTSEETVNEELRNYVYDASHARSIDEIKACLDISDEDWMKNIEICELVAHDQRYNLMLMTTNIGIFNMLRLLILESSSGIPQH